MIFLLFATLLGGAVTFLALLPYGVLIALVAAPFGGSTSCLLAGAVLHATRSHPGKRTAAEPTNATLQPR